MTDFATQPHKASHLVSDMKASTMQTVLSTATGLTPLQGKTYLLTGAAGFIGSHLTQALLNAGAHVVAIDDFNDFYDPRIKHHNILPFLNNPAFTLHTLDIRDKNALESVIQPLAAELSYGGIIHLAARAGVRPSLREPRLYLETNVTGTLNLAELAQRYHIKKFVFASSSSVYGDSALSVPFKETQDISRPISPYASTKAMGESLLHTYSHLYDIQVVCLRFFTVYGPAQRPDLAIHKFTRMIDEGLPIPVYGDGSTERDYTYIDDIIQGVMAAVQYDKTMFEVFNLGESQTTSLDNLIQTIEMALGKKAMIDPYPPQPGDVPITFADISKAQKLLHYHPKTKIAEGIPLFVNWYRQHQTLAPAG